jgi:hypothetical protein
MRVASSPSHQSTSRSHQSRLLVRIKQTCTIQETSTLQDTTTVQETQPVHQQHDLPASPDTSPIIPSSSEASNVSYKCSVLMCDAFFSSQEKLNIHLVSYAEHTPCHPYKHMLDLELLWLVKEYRCPVCYKSYEV